MVAPTGMPTLHHFAFCILHSAFPPPLVFAFGFCLLSWGESTVGVVNRLGFCYNGENGGGAANRKCAL